MPHESPVVTNPHVSSKRTTFFGNSIAGQSLEIYAQCIAETGCPKCCTHSSYDAPTPCDNWSPNLRLFTSIHSSPPLNWPKCTVLHTTKNELNLKRENLDLPPQSYTLYVFIMCEISTKRQEKRIYVNYVSLWCDQVVSGLLANNFLVPSFENISEK